MNTPASIICHQLSRRWGSRIVLDRVELTVVPTEFVAITGPSGAGKSTLLRVLGALDRRYTGEVSLFGTLLSEQNDRALSRLRNERLAFVFQAHQLLPHLTVEENIWLPWTYRKKRPSREAHRERMYALLDDLGLHGRAGDFPDSLSGGQQQRVAIARALSMQPDVLLCDELTGNLDRQTADAVMDVIESYKQTHKVAIVMVSHDPKVVQRAQTIYSLANGVLTRVNSNRYDESHAGTP